MRGLGWIALIAAGFGAFFLKKAVQLDKLEIEPIDLKPDFTDLHFDDFLGKDIPFKCKFAVLNPNTKDIKFTRLVSDIKQENEIIGFLDARPVNPVILKARSTTVLPVTFKVSGSKVAGGLLNALTNLLKGKKFTLDKPITASGKLYTDSIVVPFEEQISEAKQTEAKQ